MFRYACPFSIVEMSLVYLGYHTPFIFYMGLFLILKDPDLNCHLTLTIYCMVFMCLNLTIFAGNLWTNIKYEEGYIERADDLVGETDLNRRLVEEKREVNKFETLRVTFKQVLLPLSMVILNQSMNSPISQLFYLSHADPSFLKAQKWVMFTTNLGEAIGNLLCITIRFIKVKWLLTLLAGKLVLWYILILDSSLNKAELSSMTFNWFICLLMLSSIGGFVSVQLARLAVSMVHEKYRKTVGFLLFFAHAFGSSYGDFSTLLSFSERQPN